MNLADMTIEAIETRLAEIETEKAEPEITSEKAEELVEEARALVEEQEKRIATAEKRQADLQAVIDGETETTTVEKIEEERKTMTDMEVRKSAAYVDAFAN